METQTETERPSNRLRKPLEGVGNIVRFNWQFYALAAGAGAAIWLGRPYLPAPLRPYALLGLAAVAAPTLVSLLVSFYVYDCSALYSLRWLAPAAPAPGEATETGLVVNIHAGFDETSRLLRHRFPQAELAVFDFYDPARHTEVSIRRARAAYPPFPGTEPVQTRHLPRPAGSAEWVLVVLAAHEIRQPAERVAFLREARRLLRPTGTLVVVEHLRDPANFLAYTIGFLHFYSGAVWRRAFAAAGLAVGQEKKLTPFISAFFLRPDGAAA